MLTQLHGLCLHNEVKGRMVVTENSKSSFFCVCVSVCVGVCRCLWALHSFLDDSAESWLQTKEQ